MAETKSGRIVKSYCIDKELAQEISEKAKGNVSDFVNDLLRKGLSYNDYIEKIDMKAVVEWMVKGYNKKYPNNPYVLYSSNKND